MATYNLIQLLGSGLRDLNGEVLAGGKVYHYAAGTTTLKNLYTNAAGATPAAQPLILDSRGCAKVYGTGLYDLVVQDADGASVETFSGLNAGEESGIFSAANILTLLKTVDGAASGLDADLLDGAHASSFLTTASYTAADILTKLKTVDGAGSGLDADLLDGQHAAAFATAAQGTKADAALPTASYTAADVLAKLLTVDGVGTGLDADKVDGLEAAAFALAAHAHALSALSDVTISTPAAGEGLKYDGSKWVNGAIGGKGLTGVVYGTTTVEITAPSYLVHFYVSGASIAIAVYTLTKLGTLDINMKVDGATPDGSELILLTSLSFQYGSGFSGSGDFILVFA